LRAVVLWRITPTHHLRLMYFNNTVKRSKVLDEAIAWGDFTFNAGSRVDYRNSFEITDANGNVSNVASATKASNVPAPLPAWATTASRRMSASARSPSTAGSSPTTPAFRPT
jgi:hypothetical protein